MKPAGSAESRCT